MYNNLFQQQATAPTFTSNNFGTMPTFPQNNGLNFGNVTPAKTSSSTPEEMALIKSKKGTNFKLDDTELAVAGWDFRDGQNLAIEIIDPSTDRVRVKYTNEEFNIVMAPVDALKEYLVGLKNFVYTAKLTDTSDDQATLKELFTAFGIIDKLLPQAYENGQKNYQTLTNQMTQMMNAQGYQGTWGGQPMFNGAIGAVPNYYINEGYNGYQQPQQQVNPQMMQQMLQQAAAMGANAAQQQMMNAATNFNNNMMNMGSPMPTGGTIMGNAFVQGGQPQQMPQQMVPNQPQATPVTPQLNNIPMPGAPVQPKSGTPNPSMGSTTTIKI